MEAERWWKITDQQPRQRRELWASGRRCFGINCFFDYRSIYDGRRPHYVQRSTTGMPHHDLDLCRKIDALCTSTRQEESLLDPSWENLIELDQKTWFFLSFFLHTYKVFTFTQLKPPLLCTSFLFLCMCLWYISVVFAFFFCPPYSPSLPWTDSSLPPAHNSKKKKALCWFLYLLLPSCSFGDKKAVLHAWFLRVSTSYSWVWRRAERIKSLDNCTAFPQQQWTREEDETEK